MEEGAIEKWHKKEGEHIESGDLIIEVSTDKATIEHNALDEGYLRKILVPAGQTASVNTPIAILTEEADENIDNYSIPKNTPPPPTKNEEKHTESTPTPPPKKTNTGLEQPHFTPQPPLENYTFDAARSPTPTHILASPLAKKLAKEQKRDLSTITGSGPGGRIVAKDVERAQPNTTTTFSRRETPTLAPGSYTETPLSPMRKAIGRRLQESKTFIPHYYVTQNIDATPLSQTREQLKSWDLKISVNDFIIRACALALREHPTINSGLNTETNSITTYNTIDISIAVSMEEGLITPIIRHADYKNLGEIATEVKSLAKKAREGKLQAEEYQGGSFTISNLGMYGISNFTAIINPPQGAILAVGSIIDTAIVKNNTVQAGKTMEMTLSSDHRIIDGATAASFLATLRKYLENPAGLLL